MPLAAFGELLQVLLELVQRLGVADRGAHLFLEGIESAFGSRQPFATSFPAAARAACSIFLRRRVFAHFLHLVLELLSHIGQVL